MKITIALFLVFAVAFASCQIQGTISYLSADCTGTVSGGSAVSIAVAGLCTPAGGNGIYSKNACNANNTVSTWICSDANCSVGCVETLLPMCMAGPLGTSIKNQCYASFPVTPTSTTGWVINRFAASGCATAALVAKLFGPTGFCIPLGDSAQSVMCNSSTTVVTSYTASAAGVTCNGTVTGSQTFAAGACLADPVYSTFYETGECPGAAGATTAATTATTAAASTATAGATSTTAKATTTTGSTSGAATGTTTAKATTTGTTTSNSTASTSKTTGGSGSTTTTSAAVALYVSAFVVVASFFVAAF